jgi:hypothetical protein
MREDSLERQHAVIGRPTEGTARKLVEGNQVHLATEALEQFYQSMGVFVAIVYTSE